MPRTSASSNGRSAICTRLPLTDELVERRLDGLRRERRSRLTAHTIEEILKRASGGAGRWCSTSRHAAMMTIGSVARCCARCLGQLQR